jgi:hypothetical protein
MQIWNENFLYTTKLRPGKVAMLKNGVTVIGVENELEARWEIFKGQEMQGALLDHEDAIIDVHEEISSQVTGQLADSVDEFMDAMFEHVSLMERRAFLAGYYAANKKECPVATTEHSDLMAR